MYLYYYPFGLSPLSVPFNLRPVVEHTYIYKIGKHTTYKYYKRELTYILQPQVYLAVRNLWSIFV